MKVGVDFDNTIVCCDDLFYKSAQEKGLISAPISQTKDAVRNYLRETGREEAWIELQGYVYGKMILEAPPFPGVDHFFATCRSRGIPAVIISHKTRHPFKGPTFDLHETAYEWLKRNGFLTPTMLERSEVFLELKKEDKIRRIDTERCTVFIDDLPEFLTESKFPPHVQRILFDPQKKQTLPPDVTLATSWNDIERSLLNAS